MILRETTPPAVGTKLLLDWNPGEEAPQEVTVVSTGSPFMNAGEFDVSDGEGAWTVMQMDVDRGVTWTVVS